MALAELAYDGDWAPRPTVLSNPGSRPAQVAPRRSRKMSDPEVPEWAISVRQQLVYIGSLREDWDGFGAHQIRRDVLTFMATMLESLMKHETPSLHLTPMSHEGVQVEWHENGIDLEIEIEAPGEVWVSCEIDGEEQDWSLTSDFSPLADVINELTRRAG